MTAAVDGAPLAGTGERGTHEELHLFGRQQFNESCIAAREVAAVKVEPRDGRLVEAALYDAPRELQAEVRFFIVRLALASRDTPGKGLLSLTGPTTRTALWSSASTTDRSEQASG